VNPLGDKRPKYGPKEKDVRHCYQTAPLSGDELHNLARHLFLARGHRSEVLAFQLLFEAMTGLRRGEAVQMRWDATSRGQFGFIERWKYLHVPREKGGVAPWVEIHPALKDLLLALKSWRDRRYPQSPWFFPSCYDEGRDPVEDGALGKALAKAAEVVAQARRTTHGLRAFYVTVRRSQGVPDQIIACEIGHSTGGTTLVKAYGGVPKNWYMIDHPELSWMPSANQPPAWAVLAQEQTGDNIINLALEQDGVETVGKAVGKGKTAVVAEVYKSLWEMVGAVRFESTS
jgi:hypothetical protein